MYAELAIYLASVRRTFHYEVPDGMPAAVGQLVEVSFRTGLSQGIVLALSEESTVPHPKPIREILVPEPVVTPLQIALAGWLAERTLSPIGACLWLMLPPGLARRGAMSYMLVDPTYTADEKTAGVIELLRDRGPLRSGQIDRALPRTGWRNLLHPLIVRGIVRCEPVLLAPDAKSQVVKTVRLNVPAADVPELAGHLLQSPKQAAVLSLLARQNEPVEMGWIMRQAGASTDSIRRLEKKGFIIVGESERLRDPLEGRDFPPSAAPSLTQAQAECWRVIECHMANLRLPDSTEAAQTYLLHGVTGSGKTEIYLQAIDLALRQGRQAIVLVPEIALVAPTVGRFASRFPNQVAVVHSALTDGEQYDTWQRARAGQIGIVIGARSALFTPLPDVGLVVIDEEHDDSYKQSPPLPPPYYHARETAIAMMRLNRGTVILGSATPDLTTTFRARAGEILHLQLPDRVIVPRSDGDSAAPAEAIAAPLPPVEVVDMRRELREDNRSMFSRTLRAALETTLNQSEQALLFLNRRGNATFVLCRDCGYVARCPNCDIPLTYHQSDPLNASSARLSCHYCSYQAAPPAECPQCKSKRIRYFGAGTASVEEAVIKEFPGAQVLRWDRDTAQSRGAHEAIWQQFAAGQANVLVGTQMIVKGLDLPRVTLVGAMLADTAIGLPNYRAGERTFQLLTQVAGRAGRGWRGGRVIFQTYQPEHYAIRAASGHDYNTFYAQEIEYRRVLQYPPFKRLVRFLFRAPSAHQAQHEAETAARLLREQITALSMSATSLIGPTPAFFGKIDGMYQWQIIVRTTDPARLLGTFNARQNWIVDIDPVDTL